MDEEIDDELSNLEKKSKKIKSNKKEPIKKKKLKKIILFILAIIAIFLIINLFISAYRWKLLVMDMFLNENSVVIDSNGNIVATLGSEKIKEKVSYDSIPDNLKKAYIAIEDERFYSHSGVDIKRSTAATISYITHFGSSSFGGSTITQQLVKNLTGNSSDKVSRKIIEWWQAWLLENYSNKDEILDMYLNTIYVGPNIYGVGAGSKYYFNKPVSALTLEECAFLAGINNSPNSYNPFIDANNSEKISKRAKIVLNKMKELEYISQDDFNQAISNLESGLKFEKGTVNAPETSVYSYHTDALINEVTSEIAQKYKISETFALNYLEMSGTKIYSTQNSSIQKEIEAEFEKSKYSLPSKNGGNSSQAAMVVIDHTQGYVLGCAGGLGKKTDVRPLNRATQSIRQTGSAMKPLAILAPAIDKKIITASSIFDDTEIDFENGYHPTDYNTPLGEITVRRAVESSQNVPFVLMMERLTPKKSIKYLKNMGISTLTDNDKNLALALGGLDKGISPLEMAAGYATIANDGQYIEPTFYIKIDRKNGKTLLKSKQKKKKVISEQASFIIKELLTEPVNGSNGTANYCKISGVDVSAKTGTTDENYDRWLCGFTPYYTAATWFGYDINESIDFNNRNPAGLIWANVMNRIHSGLPSATFQMPSKVSCETVCDKSGCIATTGCPSVHLEYFLKNTEPDLCQYHSGSNVQTTTTNKPQSSGIIQGSQNEIDAEEPPRITNTTPQVSTPASVNKPDTNSTSNTVNNVVNFTPPPSENDISNVTNSSNIVDSDNKVSSSEIDNTINYSTTTNTTNTTNEID